jgi:hypothetical protein
MRIIGFRYWLWGVFLVMTAAPFFAAAEECGAIVSRVPNSPTSWAIEGTEPIVDCNNPFNADESVAFTFSLTLAEQLVETGSTVVLPEGTERVPVRLSV